MFDFLDLKDSDVCRIIDLSDYSARANKARSAIIKVYTYETDVYPALNAANCTKDTTKIESLGPLAYLLSCSLKFWEDGRSTFGKEISKLPAQKR